MCYGNPHQMLVDMLNVRHLEPDRHGHTALDDFLHFCAYSGCDPATIGSDAFAWAKLAYVAAKLSPLSTQANAFASDPSISDDRRNAEQNASTVR